MEIDLDLQSLLELCPLLGVHQVRRAVLPSHVKVTVHVLNGDVILLHQLPAQSGSVGKGCLAGLIDTVPDGVTHLNADRVGIGDDAVHGAAASLVGVGVLAAADGPRNLQIGDGQIYGGIVHKVMGTGLDDVPLEVRGVVCRLVPVIPGVVVHQIPDLAGIPGTAIVPGVRQLLLYRVAHLLSLPSCLITWLAPVAARPLTMPTAAAVM